MKKIVAIIMLPVLIGCSMKTFGQYPTDESLKKIESSSNYDNGSFHNQNKQEARLSSDVSLFKTAMKYIFGNSDTKPDRVIPVIKTPLHDLNFDKPTLIWFGHSSYLISYNGYNILIDPVFSNYAAPFSFLNKAYKYSDNFTAADMPDIDLLLITHDHYDHLDYQTITALKSKVKQIITPLGVGSHLAYWGYERDNITELDWYDRYQVDNDTAITSTPAHHFSGRSISSSKMTLWTSYALEIDGYKIFIGGDGGYEKHFKEIGALFGGFDLAILENGQFNENWRATHLFPAESLQALIDLNAKTLLPVHWGKFTLSTHTWNGPIKELTEMAEKSGQKVTTPMIGEPWAITDEPKTDKWWE